MFYVPEEHIFRHGKRKPDKIGGILAIVPPRHARRSLQEIFPKGYWLGDRPSEDCSADVPAYLWKENHTKIYFARNPYARVESMHRSYQVRKLTTEPGGKSSTADFGKFIDWLIGSEKARHFGWTQKKWMAGGTKIGDMRWPIFDPDYIVQVEDLAGGLNHLGVLEHKLGEDDIPYVIAQNENRFEYAVHEWDWRDQYDKSLIRKVRKAYYEDFELCGYSTSLDDAHPSPDIGQT